MKPVTLLPLFFLLASFSASAAGSAALRIVCDGDAEGAEVYINGKFKGECPLDMKVPEGKLKLRVQKVVDADHEPRRFEQEIRLGEGVVKTVEVQLGPLELNAKGKRRQVEQFNSIETGMVAISGKNYELGKYEVTQGQWKVVMGSPPPRLKYTNCGDNCPVEGVSWEDIQEFLQALNQKSGKQYRLPTAAEWKYACYGGSQTEYCGGNNPDVLGWHGDNSGGTTHPVGQKQANGYGLYDMMGNVSEWVEDIHNNKNDWRKLCGSSLSNAPSISVSSSENAMTASFRSRLFGFRLARTLP